MSRMASRIASVFGRVAAAAHWDASQGTCARRIARAPEGMAAMAAMADRRLRRNTASVEDAKRVARRESVFLRARRR
jgi:hypothetical protein